MTAGTLTGLREGTAWDMTEVAATGRPGEGLVEEVARQAREGRFDYLRIEATGVSDHSRPIAGVADAREGAGGTTTVRR
jgi:hypothetical protein